MGAKPDPQAGAPEAGVGKADTAVLLEHQIAAQTQSDPGAGRWLGRVVEQACAHRRIEARSVIVEMQLQ